MPYDLRDNTPGFIEFFQNIIDYFSNVPDIMNQLYNVFPEGVTTFFFMTFAFTFGFAFLLKIIRTLL